ncbi:hypothetical protein OC842_008010 [Tilletia horrida]|uniref:Uncharacterized protein n=1 Tax=Tilletia horrida TaxID=155126 RepID=A0AAN6G2S2_9BASI|nr:hypothetical protein OC842_008010 [Tilletia horrida]
MGSGLGAVRGLNPGGDDSRPDGAIGLELLRDGDCLRAEGLGLRGGRGCAIEPAAFQMSDESSHERVRPVPLFGGKALRSLALDERGASGSGGGTQSLDAIAATARDR